MKPLLKNLKAYLFVPRWHLSRFQFNLFSILFLSIGLIGGTYLTLLKVFPNVFAINDTTQIWTFDAGHATDYTTASTIMTVDANGAHPTGGVDGANEITNSSFTANNNSWTLTALQSATNTPAGWVVVPGNSNFVATGSAFLAMKYEAKCANSATPTVGLTSPADTSYEVYRDDGTATAANNCTAANGRVVTSLASGYPITYLYQTEAATRCATVTVGGAAAHLITNDEWMTIANDAEQQAGNWTGAAVGSGYLFAGHNDNTPAKARVASTTDTGNYRCAYTDASPGTEAPSACPTKTALGESGLVGNQVRVLTLSNGQPIWDIVGNVWEWTNNTVPANLQPTSWNGTTDATTGDWSDYASGSLPRYLHSYVSGSPVTKLKSEPTSSSYTHNATYGIGRIWNYSLSSSSTAYGFLRGGDWNNIGNAGAFTLYLNITPVYRNYNLGFRCASDPVALSQSQSSSIGRGAAGGEVLVVPAVADAKFTQSINLGEVASYDFSAYVYDTTSSGGAVSETVAQLYFNGAVVNPTTYTAVTGETGWYKLTGTVTSTNSAVEYGLFVKAGKTVRVDDFTLSKSGTAYSVFTKNGYFKNDVSSWDSFSASVTNNGTNGSVVYQLCTDDLGDAAAVGQGTACQAQNKWKWWNGSAWVYATNSTTEVNTAAQLTQAVMQHASLGTSSKKISVKAILSFGGVDYPKIATITLGLTTDTTPPTNATGLYMNNENGVTCTDTDNCWTKLTGPTFSWTAGSDTQSPTVRYCVYLGTDAAGEPATDKGKLGTSPVTVPVGWTCQFLISATSLDLSTAGYLATALSNADVFTTTANTYYLKIKAVDNGGNTSTTSLSMKFRYDGTAPTNVTSINPASGNFSNVSDMNFSWPVSPAIAASIDNESQVLGWQYQINPSVDTNGVTTSAWKGTTHSTNFNLDYIPATASAYTFVTSRDSDGSSVGVGKVSSGTNQIYFRTVDNVGNFSSNATIRTGSISFGGIAPSFIQTDSVTITPDSATTNSYALSWPAATATTNKTVTHYYYMINASPPTTLATLQGNASTYIDNGTATTVAVRALPNVNKGTNTVRVVAIDSATVPNYSSSNVISGTFVLDSDIPDNVGNLVASDSSIKSQSQWNVTLTWTAPVYQGAGNLTYIVKRSTDNVTFTQVGTSTGLSYVDNAPASALYYYEVITKDNTADGYSSGTNAVSITPTGKWTTAPTLDSGPDEGSITTKKATITWTTSRTSDSKVQYGTTSGSYSADEVSNSSQVSSHTVNLTNLKAGTTYYYKVKWTDEDGNTGTSDENSFTTASAPTIKDVTAGSIGLSSTIIQYTAKDASKVKIYYGKTTSFGGLKEVSTSTSETTYTTQLSDLDDGTKYYYKINSFDSEGAEYEGTILDFTTLPRPKISGVRLETVANTAQTTIRVTWTTNTEVSSIVTYYPEGNSAAVRDEVKVTLEKGAHSLMIRGLSTQTRYLLVVRGRDKLGNEAISDTQRFTTATDTRPPTILNLKVIGGTISPVGFAAGDVKAQLIITWDTDEPATGQVEFGQGSGTTYSQKSQFDGNMASNHTVILSGLIPSQVYHLHALSQDASGNPAVSIDLVTIAPKATRSALDLVVKNLSEAFGFIGSIQLK